VRAHLIKFPAKAQATDLRDIARQLVAKHRARLTAARHGHRLEPFRAGDGTGYELAFCVACRAGVSMHIGTASLSVSEALLQACPLQMTGVS
jgi:hypothetical protein